MARMDYAMKQTVPYYSHIKKAMATRPKEKKTKRRKGPTTLTEYSESGSKPVLKNKVSVNQAARKLYEYEQSGLSPQEVLNLIVRAENLERRVKKYESWEN